MSTDNFSVRKYSRGRSNRFLENIWNEFGKLGTFLISNSAPMSKSDKVGLTLTIIALVVILSPLAFSDSDPYRLKWIFDEVKENVPLINGGEENHEKQYRVIAQLKISQETHLDATEKIILGKYRVLTN